MFGKNSWKVIVVIAICSVVMGISAYGGPVPQRVNYQGTLSNKGGGPANGSFNMTFRVYSTATGSVPLWTETWSSTNSSPVTVTDGVFNVMLGSLTPLSNDFFANYPRTYLGVSVANDSEMLPRQMIASVGYAFAAGNGVPKGGIIMWSGAVNQIPDGWALCDGTNGTPNLRDRFIVGAGNTYAVGAVGGNPSTSINLSHSHTANDHSHTYSGGTSVNSGSNKSASDGSSAAPSNHTHTYSGTTTGASNRGTDSQLTSPIDIRPPYYALAFIMKL